MGQLSVAGPKSWCEHSVYGRSLQLPSSRTSKAKTAYADTAAAPDGVSVDAIEESRACEARCDSQWDDACVLGISRIGPDPVAELSLAVKTRVAVKISDCGGVGRHTSKRNLIATTQSWPLSHQRRSCRDDVLIIDHHHLSSWPAGCVRLWHAEGRRRLGKLPFSVVECRLHLPR